MVDYDEEQDERVTKVARHELEAALALAKDLVARFPSISQSRVSLSYAYTIIKE